MFIEHYLTPDTTTERWCELYGLLVKTGKCSQCSKALSTLIPFATKELRGLHCGPCPDCGNPRTPFCFIQIEKN